MGSKAASAHDSFELFLRLLSLGFQHFSGGEPVVLVEGNIDDSYFPNELNWPVVQASSTEAFASAFTEALMQGPVLALPSWDRQTTEGPGGRASIPRFIYEDTLQHICPNSTDSLAAVLLPGGVLYSESPRATKIREVIIEKWDMITLLHGEGILPRVHPSFTIATVFLSAKRSPPPPLRVYQIPHNEEFSSVESDFLRLLERNGGRVDHGYILRNTPAANVGLGFTRHDPATLARKESLASFGGVIPLGEIYDFPNTMPIHAAKSAGLICDEGDVGATRILSGRDIGRDGLIAAPSEETAWAKVPEEFNLAVGDLVVRSVYGRGDAKGLVIAEVKPEDLPAAAGNSLIVMRPRVALPPRRTDFTLMFLRSPLAQTLLSSIGPHSIHVSRAALAELPVPEPDQDLIEALDDLIAAKERLEEWKSEAESLLQSVFLDETLTAARIRVIESGRALRLKVETASLLDDLGYTVRTRFPYPVAARWRETEAFQSAGPSMEAYGAILDTTEILLCYAAQLALALARGEGIQLGAVQGIKLKLESGRSGPGLGDWVAVLREITTTKKLRSLPPTHPLNDLRGLLAGKAVETARQRLTERRNNQAHLRRVDEVDLPLAINNAFEDLKILVDAARFMTDWPLIQVTGVRWDSLTRTAQVEFLELMGDHPVVPTQTELHTDNNLEIGSLYLRGHERRLHLLRPFLIGRICPICRTWSTFHIDRAPSAAVVFKSLEHGHTVEEPTLTHAVQVVGLL